MDFIRELDFFIIWIIVRIYLLIVKLSFYFLASSDESFLTLAMVIKQKVFICKHFWVTKNTHLHPEVK